MNATTRTIVGGLALLAALAGWALMDRPAAGTVAPPDREEVLFWHFWGGEDRKVVEDIVSRFNVSQDQYFVRAVAMPGNNLDVKLFLSITGGDPPDLINQDDPIIADWAARGALTPLDELATPSELAQLEHWLFPAARRLVTYDEKMYGLCNGLDIRALYYNKTLLEKSGVAPPETTEELKQLASRLSERDESGRYTRFGYLPDSRRLWAWGVVFGGRFFDEDSQQATPDDPRVITALEWMAGFSREFGAHEVAAFRTGDQSLPGKTFPLLPVGDSPHGRYAAIMDGQWRVRDIRRSQESRRAAGLPVAEYDVCPLPSPPEGRKRAGWANGNYFIVPRGARNTDGAWEFMKFWAGFGHEAQAARICTEGGWIPVSQSVVDEPQFQQYLAQQPLFARFVELAASGNQEPIPVIRGAGLYNREIRNAGEQAMADASADTRQLLQRVAERVNAHRQRMED